MKAKHLNGQIEHPEDEVVTAILESTQQAIFEEVEADALLAELDGMMAKLSEQENHDGKKS